MSIFFEIWIFFFFFYFMNATPKLRPSHFCTPNFSIETSGALFTFLAMRLFRTFKIKRGTKYGFSLVYCTFRAPILKRKSLMVRQWCAHNVFFVSAHNHGIPTDTSFLATHSSLHPLRFPQSVTCCLMLNDRLFFLLARCILFSARSSPIWVIGGWGRGEANVKANAKDASSSWQWGGTFNP